MKRVLLTGATGCLGSYLLAALLQRTDFQVTVWVRQPQKLWPAWRKHPRLTCWAADLAHWPQYASELKSFDAVIHPAVVWGGAETFAINLKATQAIFACLDPERCRQIHYFSTASLLNAEHQRWRQAHTLGTDYIRSKAALAEQFFRHPPPVPMTLYYPPVIIGGDAAAHPRTALTSALPQLKAYMPFLRYLQINGGFHFIHAADLAALVIDRLIKGSAPETLVPGQAWLSVESLIGETASWYGLKPVSQRFTLQSLLPFLLPLLADKMSSWDRFSLAVRETRYQSLRPEDQGLDSAYPTWQDILAAYCPL